METKTPGLTSETTEEAIEITTEPEEPVELTEEEKQAEREQSIEEINAQLSAIDARLAEIEADEAEHEADKQAVIQKKDDLLAEYSNKMDWGIATEDYINISTILYNSNLLTVDDMLELSGSETFEELISYLKGSSVLLSNIMRANVITKSGDEDMYHDGIFDVPDISEIPITDDFLIDKTKTSTDSNGIEFIRILKLVKEASNVYAQNKYKMDKDKLETLADEYLVAIYNLNNTGYFKDNFVMINIFTTDVYMYCEADEYFEDITGLNFQEYRGTIGDSPVPGHEDENAKILTESLTARQTSEREQQQSVIDEKSDLLSTKEELQNTLAKLQAETNE